MPNQVIAVQSWPAQQVCQRDRTFDWCLCFLADQFCCGITFLKSGGFQALFFRFDLLLLGSVNHPAPFINQPQLPA